MRDYDYDIENAFRASEAHSRHTTQNRLERDILREERERAARRRRAEAVQRAQEDMERDHEEMMDAELGLPPQSGHMSRGASRTHSARSGPQSRRSGVASPRAALGARDFPAGTQLSPQNVHEGSTHTRPPDYPNTNYDAEGRSVNPLAQQSIHQSEGVEQAFEEDLRDPSHAGEDDLVDPIRRPDHRRRRSGKRRRKHRKGKRRSKSKRTKHKKEKQTRAAGSDSDEEIAEGSDEGEGFDEFGNPRSGSGSPPNGGDETVSQKHQARTRKKGEGTESDEEETEKDGKKKKGLKVAALALGALAVGLVVRKVVNRKKKKKEEKEAAQQEAQEAANFDFDGDPNQMFLSRNPLRLTPPPPKFSTKVPQNEAFVVERGGKYSKKLNSGSNKLIPCLDRIAFRYSLKETSLPIPSQMCFTRDQVGVKVNALLFVFVDDPVLASYEVDDPYRSLMLLLQTVMRREFGALTLNQVFENRLMLNDRILNDLNNASRMWGIQCTRFELRDILLPDELRASIDRETNATHHKRAELLSSEAHRDAMINRAEGEMQAQMRVSQARQVDIVNQAIGEAHAISERGEAIAGAMRDVAEAVNEPGGEKAMQMRIAEQYINAYGNAARANTQVPMPDPSHVAASMNTGIGILNTLGQFNSTAGNPYVIPEAMPYSAPHAVGQAPSRPQLHPQASSSAAYGPGKVQQYPQPSTEAPQQQHREVPALQHEVLPEHRGIEAAKGRTPQRQRATRELQPGTPRHSQQRMSASSTPGGTPVPNGRAFGGYAGRLQHPATPGSYGSTSRRQMR